ncbi:endopolygalacturonase [Cerasicoccus arenae]|uniref:Pectate lyase superfamily protein domain-containing protein n=1 Tax=Cerasicoccus arenae TaxID=424488 RepID=A0A8J3DGU2_9BACT|nr:endopolygalacturonase [Cerasicoccus arenae]MBK1857726.1 hypothetical protein [Cerasicoccus arenae]GHB91155.1 hypothetical protein GCM10007047_02640 [Cerasicoccus arenae]
MSNFKRLIRILATIVSGHCAVHAGGASFEDGFEDGMSAWIVEENEAMSFVHAEAAHNGDWGLRVVDESLEKGSSVASPRLSTSPGEVFRLRFLARNVSGKGAAAYIRFYDGAGNRISSSDGSEYLSAISRRTWRDYVVIAAAPEGAAEAEAWIHSFSKDISTTDFDSIRFEAYKPDIVPPWEPTYKLTPDDPRLTNADVPGPDGLVYPDWSQAGVSGGIPQLPVAVGPERFAGYEGKDIAELLREAVAEASVGGGVVQLPSGEFLLSAPVVIYNSRVVVRGAGSGKTRLIFQDHIPLGEIRSRTWSLDDVIGPNGFFEIQANPKNLVLLSATSEGKQVALRKLKDHWGNRFFLRLKGDVILEKLGPGRHELEVEIGYANGDTHRGKFPVIVSEEEQPGDRWLDQHAAIMILGGGPIGEPILLTQTAVRGSQQLKLASGHGVQVGDHLYIEAPTTKRWNELTGNVSPWGTFRSNQLKVIAVDGDVVNVEQPLRIDFPFEDASFVQPIRVIEYSGVENLTIEQKVFTQELVGPRIPETLWYPIEDLWTDGVTFCYVWNSWVSDVNIINSGRNPLYLTRSKFCELRDVEVRGALFKGGGGTGYVGLERSYDCLVENIATWGMRHAPNLQWGSAGNVIRDSRFMGSDGQWHAGWTHENLYENNRIEQSVKDLGQGTYGHGFFASGPSSTAHGPQGPRNVVYYNDVIAPKSGITMLGGNEAWIIVYNRFLVEEERGVYAKEKSFDHIISHNVFVLPNCRGAAILIGAANCTGLEIFDNRIYGPVSTVAEFRQGVGEFFLLADNQIFPMPQEGGIGAPRPDPVVKSIFEWQRTHALRTPVSFEPINTSIQ